MEPAKLIPAREEAQAPDRPSLLKRNLVLLLSYLAIMGMIAGAYAS